MFLARFSASDPHEVVSPAPITAPLQRSRVLTIRMAISALDVRDTAAVGAWIDAKETDDRATERWS